MQHINITHRQTELLFWCFADRAAQYNLSNEPT